MTGFVFKISLVLLLSFVLITRNKCQAAATIPEDFSNCTRDDGSSVDDGESSGYSGEGSAWDEGQSSGDNDDYDEVSGDGNAVPCEGHGLQTIEYNAGTSSRIVGGSDTHIQNCPWQVGLLESNGNNGIFCGGSLLNQEWVLTAAHCISNIVGSRRRSAHGCLELDASDSSQRFKVVLGESDLKKVEGNEIYRDISKVCMHPSYDEETMANDNDIALLHLGTVVEYNNFTRPICLPSSSKDFSAGTRCFVTGWGKIWQSGPVSDRLRVAKVAIINRNNCRKMYKPSQITTRMTCAGYPEGGIDSCQGDSGGPLVCPENGTLVLAGAVSWGDGCAKTRKPGVYTNIISFRPWIDKVIRNV